MNRVDGLESIEAAERVEADRGSGEGIASAIVRAAGRTIAPIWCWAVIAVLTPLFFAVGHLAGLVVGQPRAFAAVMGIWARLVLRGGRCRVEVDGDPGAAAGRLVIANHQSFADSVVLAAVLPPPVHFVTRVELLRAPIIGSVLRAGHHLPLVRRRGTNVRRLLAEVGERLAAGGTVVFYPEGSRSPDGEVAPFRPGVLRAAAAADRPVVPVVLSGTRRLWPRGSVRLSPGRVAVAILDPRPVGAADVRDRGWRDDLRAEMEARRRTVDPGTAAAVVSRRSRPA